MLRTNLVCLFLFATLLQGWGTSIASEPDGLADIERFALDRGWLDAGVSRTTRTFSSGEALASKGGHGSTAKVGAGGFLCLIQMSQDERGLNGLSYSLGDPLLLDNETSRAFSFFHEASHCEFAKRYRAGKFKSRQLDDTHNEQMESAINLNALLPGFKHSAGSAAPGYWHSLFEENYADVRAILMLSQYRPAHFRAFLDVLRKARQGEGQGLTTDSEDVHVSAPALNHLIARGFDRVPQSAEALSDMAFEIASEGFVSLMQTQPDGLGLPTYLQHQLDKDIARLGAPPKDNRVSEMLSHAYWRKYQTPRILAAVSLDADRIPPPARMVETPAAFPLKPQMIRIRQGRATSPKATQGVTRISASWMR